MNGVHDMGGMHGLGPVEPRENDDVFHEEWEKRVAAILGITRGQNLFNIDEFRHGIERMDPAHYLRAGYYERWLATLETNLAEKRLVSREEVEARLKELRRDPDALTPRREDPALAERITRSRYAVRELNAEPGTPRFAPGDAVVTRNVHPRGHTRLPRYARGKRGVIDRYYGAQTLPDANAHGRGPSPEPLYSVRFDARELWGESAEPRQSVNVDLWESYLEPGGEG